MVKIKVSIVYIEIILDKKFRKAVKQDTFGSPKAAKLLHMLYHVRNKDFRTTVKHTAGSAAVNSIYTRAHMISTFSTCIVAAIFLRVTLCTKQYAAMVGRGIIFGRGTEGTGCVGFSFQIFNNLQMC